MPIPSPQERPDLYDGYDGLPEGHVSSVTTPPELQKMLDDMKAKRPAPPAPDERPAAGGEEKPA